MTDESPDSLISGKEAKITIQQSKDAVALIRLAELIGLEDVTQWTTVNSMQQFLDTGQWIALIAMAQKPGKNTEPCGAIIAGFEEERRLWIELLVVAQDYRRKSVASALVTQLEEVGKEQGCRALFVDLDDDNKPAMQFYLGVGFQNAGIIREYYYDGTNAIILLKHL